MLSWVELSEVVLEVETQLNRRPSVSYTHLTLPTKLEV